MRVLHCPCDTGGNAWGLSRAERLLGIQSDVMVRRSSYRGYPSDIDLRLRTGSLPGRVLRLTQFVLRATRAYDVFHFNWGMSILDYWRWNLNYLELPLLKRLGKRIVMTFQGCDARIKTLSQQRFSTSACAECDVSWCTERMDKIRMKRFQKVMSYVDKVFALNPDLMHFLPNAELLPYASVDPAAWVPQENRGGPPAPQNPIQILHLPTNQSIKGTRYVERACADLQAEGWPVQLHLVQGVPHAEVQALIANSDLVVDQLLIGWYGAFAVEAMSMGKPVLCYLRDDDLKRFVPFENRIPIVRTSKETLTHDLRALIEDPARRSQLGWAGRQFVLDVHDPREIAKRTLAVYQQLCAA